MCIPATGSSYAWYSTSCSENPIDFGASVRGYLVKSSYVGSSTCEGQPLQAMAVAADATCHSVPGTTPPQWFKANCNGGSPIWDTCSDASCSNCTTTRYVSDQCQLSGAGASESVKCFTAKKTSNTTSSQSASPSSTGGVSDLEDPTRYKSDAGNSSGMTFSWTIVTLLILSFVL